MSLSFTANHKETTVSNFASTFDNADHSSKMASAPSDTTIVNQIKSKFCGIQLNQIKFAFNQITQFYLYLFVYFQDGGCSPYNSGAVIKVSSQVNGNTQFLGV